MKESTDRLTALAKALSGEVMQAEADGSVEMPPRLLQVVELPSPLRSFIVPPANAPFSDSFNFRTQTLVAGAGGGGTVTSALMQPGVWRIKGWFLQQFTGTSNIANGSSLLMTLAPDSIALGQAAAIVGTFVIPFDFVISILKPVNLVFTGSATAAGDFLFAACQAVCSRLF